MDIPPYSSGNAPFGGQIGPTKSVGNEKSCARRQHPSWSPREFGTLKQAASIRVQGTIVFDNPSRLLAHRVGSLRCNIR